MTELLPASAWPFCQAGPGCDRAPCFEARVEAVAGQRCVRTRTELCAQHVGATIQALTAWARDQGLTGEVTVLAIDLPDPGQAVPAWGRSGLAFSTIKLSA